MRRKTLAMLLVVMMVISMVPTTALAATEYAYIPNGNGTHTVTYVVDNDWDNEVIVGPEACTNNGKGYCTVCTGAIPAAPECDHWAHSGEWTAKSNGNNTHNNICVCEEVMGTVDCVVDCVCGGYVAPVVPECDHWAHTAEWTAESNGNNTHNNICVCEEVMGTVDCQPECICGGYVAPECDHWAYTAEWTAESNGDNTHNNICVCGETVNTVACVEDCVCGGYVAPEDKPESVPSTPVKPVMPNFMQQFWNNWFEALNKLWGKFPTAPSKPVVPSFPSAPEAPEAPEYDDVPVTSDYLAFLWNLKNK